MNNTKARVPWTARRSNQSILGKINPEYSLEGLTLKLKLQYYGHLMRSIDSLEKTLILGKTEGRRRREWQRMRWLDGIPTRGHELEQTLGGNEGLGKPGVLHSMGLQSQSWCRDWTAMGSKCLPFGSLWPHRWCPDSLRSSMSCSALGRAHILQLIFFEYIYLFGCVES